MAAGAGAAIYVYYRVGADTGDALERVAALFADVERDTGVKGRLCARRDDPGTWMEVYEAVADPDAFAARLDALAQRHRVAEFAAAGARHVECFVPLPGSPGPRDESGTGGVQPG